MYLELLYRNFCSLFWDIVLLILSNFKGAGTLAFVVNNTPSLTIAVFGRSHTSTDSHSCPNFSS
jgi:hypothetical protein